MATGQAPVLALHPGRLPFAVVAGRAVCVGIFIPGKPHAKDRPRARVMPLEGGRHNAKSPCGYPLFYSTEEMKDYERHVGETAMAQLKSVPGDFLLPFQDCRVIASLRFNFLKPSGYPKSRVHMTVRPDLDNLQKAVYDGLVKYGVLKDDSPITDHIVMKRYADDQHPEGVEIELTILPL